MKISILFIPLVIWLVLGCQSKKKEPLESFDLNKLQWLLGTWKGDAEGQPIYENWTKTSENQFSNANFNVSNGDTTISSRSAIEILNNKIVFSADNTIWELTYQTDKESIFENKQKGEKFTFSLTEKNEWKALYNYPTSQIRYLFTKVNPINKVPE